MNGKTQPVANKYKMRTSNRKLEYTIDTDQPLLFNQPPQTQIGESPYLNMSV